MIVTTTDNKAPAHPTTMDSKSPVHMQPPQPSNSLPPPSYQQDSVSGPQSNSTHLQPSPFPQPQSPGLASHGSYQSGAGGPPPPGQGSYQPPQGTQGPWSYQGSQNAPTQPSGPQKSPAQVGEDYRAALYAQCAQGHHEPKTNYGVCGIITAVIFFPIGLICLFIDTETVCRRCGVLISA